MRFRFPFCYLMLMLFILISCSKEEGTLFTLLEVEKHGINFKNTIVEKEKHTILDYLYFYNGGGVALGDINNDGLPDLFFSGNEVKNKLYLNEGNLKFSDISEKAGIQGKSDWNTGVVMADVNGDGWLDIYVCAVVGIHGFKGKNELFINQGDGTFSEQAAAYKLDLENYATTASFFDYDLDGDLDMYLLNQAVHSEHSFGKASTKFKRNVNSGDKLFENKGAFFEDVSEQAGIFGGANGYGLGVAVSDFNLDGYPDIYVSNDFHEDDYYYINNGDGTFTESLKQYFGHTSKFSMGNDVADINNDGYPDVMTLDMLSDDEVVLKSSIGDETPNMQQMRIDKMGYHYQYARNMLQLNNEGKSFSEVALQSGVAATDWSWSALFADYNQDGIQDLFISNGIPKRPNNLDYVKFISNEQIKRLLQDTKLVDKKALELMPAGEVQNFIYQGSGNIGFIDKSNTWIPEDMSISNGAVYGDLDNDGDLDLITNNLNSSPLFYINKTNKKASYLKLKLTYKGKNPFGIGTKVKAYSNGKMQYKELFLSRGFQSSTAPVLHFGFGKQKEIDSVKITWPNGVVQLITNVDINKTLTIKYKETNAESVISENKANFIFKRVADNLGIVFKQEENKVMDFNTQRLIPFKISDRGVETVVSDVDGDGLEEVIFGSANGNSRTLFHQNGNGFSSDVAYPFIENSATEDAAILIEDFNNDGRNDVFISNGGGINDLTSPFMMDEYYTQGESGFVSEKLPVYFKNTAVAKSADFNLDGYKDIFIGGGAIPGEYGKAANSYILQNDNGTFKLLHSKALENLGIVTDASWIDFDDDGDQDLIVVGEWMSPKFLRNDKEDFVDISQHMLKKPLEGLWQAIIPFDVDEDGDIDYLLGNWGLNSKFKASEEFPMQMFYDDFDKNGVSETIIAIEKDKEYYTLLGLDELSTQMVSLIKPKFPSYKKFAGKTLNEVFDKELLAKADYKQVNTLASGYLKNESGKFSFVPFHEKLQIAPITTFLSHDFTKNGKEEVLIGGNYFGLTPFHGRLDAFSGALLFNKDEFLLGSQLGIDLTKKQIQDLDIIIVKGQEYLLVSSNNEEAVLYKIP